MCGIYGAINCKISREIAQLCLNKMLHRGPDGWGILEWKNLILGHRRLSILDLSENGKQPMEAIGGRYLLTFNGEIYNFLELRKELELLGYTFHTKTDTEIIPAAYDAWGNECQNRFNGMWAFAIYDKKEDLLFASRDRFGIKPFLYTTAMGKESFAFASEMKALTPMLDEMDVNEKMITPWAPRKFLQYESTEEALISQIKRLPAGHCLTFKNGELHIERWWNTLDHIPEIPKTYNEQVELFRELFIDSCRIRMRSDVTLGTALSGGLDSSATICSMAEVDRRSSENRVNKDWQHAFVATFPGTTQDESEYAKIVTNYLGIDNTFINIDPNDYIDDFENYLYMFEEMYTTSPIPMMATYKAVKENGVTVTLDGHGADELFGGYAFDFFSAFPDAKFHKKYIDEILKAYSDAYPHDGSNMDIGHFEQRYDIYGKYVLEYYARKILHREDMIEFSDRHHPVFRKMQAFNQKLYIESHITTLPTLLRNYDHYSMANSVEIRMPFMDYRLVTMAFALDWNSKLRGGYSKAIIRDALKPYMPQEIVNRKTKIGFNTPVVEWMQGPMRAYFEDIVDSQDFNCSSLVDAQTVRKRVLEVTRATEQVSFGQAESAYAALVPYLWEKCFYKRVKYE